VREVSGIEFPQLLEPVDDLPPATVVLSVRVEKAGGGRKARVRGVSYDNGEIARVEVNGQAAQIVSQTAGMADWEAEVPLPPAGKLSARAVDAAGNAEITAHEVAVEAAGGSGEVRSF
jgi:hypothetical protein